MRRSRSGRWTGGSVLLLCLALVACSSAGSKTRSAPPEAAPEAKAPVDAKATAPGKGKEPPASQIRVTWEALAVEREQLENPHVRGVRIGLIPNHEIVLVSESHPDAKANMLGRSAVEHKGVAVAALSDQDMMLFVRGLRSRGFFRVAWPTSTVESLYESPNARGRITVDQGGESYTLVSMRGQGENPTTKDIPALYSEAKKSIILLRNRTPTMSVITSGREPMRR
jgi:hypothetical protein